MKEISFIQCIKLPYALLVLVTFQEWKLYHLRLAADGGRLSPVQWSWEQDLVSSEFPGQVGPPNGLRQLRVRNWKPDAHVPMQLLQSYQFAQLLSTMQKF